MTQHTQNDSLNYAGDEEPDSELLIRTARKLSPDAQNVLYALLTTGEGDLAATIQSRDGNGRTMT